MDADEKKTVAKFKALLNHNCCGDSYDILSRVKASLRKENLGKLVYQRKADSKGELFYLSRAKEVVKIAELELNAEQLQSLRLPEAFEILEQEQGKI